MKKTKIISVLKNDSCDIVLDEDIITKHVLFIGSTGSGKTTTLNVLLRDLIHYKAANSAEKIQRVKCSKLFRACGNFNNRSRTFFSARRF